MAYAVLRTGVQLKGDSALRRAASAQDEPRPAEYVQRLVALVDAERWDHPNRICMVPGGVCVPFAGRVPGQPFPDHRTASSTSSSGSVSVAGMTMTDTYGSTEFSG